MRRLLKDWSRVVDRRGRFTFSLGLALALVVALLELVGAGIVVGALHLLTAEGDQTIDLPLIGNLEDALPGDDRLGDLRALVAIGVAFFVVRGVTALLQVYLLYRSAFSLGVRLADRVLDDLLRKPYEWHLSRNAAELANTVITVTQQFVTYVFTPMQAAGAHLILVLVLTGFAITVAPVASLTAAVALAGVLGLSTVLTRKRLLELGQVEVEETNAAQRIASEAMGGVREVKVFGAGPAVKSTLGRSRRRWAEGQRRRATLIALPRILIETIAMTVLLTLLALQGDTGAGALGGLGAMAYAVVRLLPSANILVTSLNTARGGEATMRTLASLLREADPDEPPRTRVPSLPVLPLTAVDLAYRYPDGTEAFSDVTLTIERGRSIGVLGRTGSGKSTLLDVLIGLLPAAKGMLATPRGPLQADLEGYWAAIGVIPQTITMLDGTLRENIAYGVPADAVDDGAMGHAVRTALLTDVVDELPLGLDTPLGDKGVRLSGGQRQRVAIARALYRRPSVLFLDEATSALDSVTESTVISSIRADDPARALVMIAHRISTLRYCDELLVMERGRVVERGTYAELLAHGDVFRALQGSEPGHP